MFERETSLLRLLGNTKLIVLALSLSFTSACGIKFNMTPEEMEKLLSGAASVSATPGADHLNFFVEPSLSGTAGTVLAIQPQVEVMDLGGVRLTTATDAITLSAFTNAACTVPATGNLTVTTNPLNAVSGLSSFAGVTYDKAETFYLRASSGSLTSDCSTAINISAAAANKLAFTTQPSSTATAGANFTTQPIVQVQDVYGNLIAAASNSITLAPFTNAACTVASSGTLSATTNPLAATAGVATFAGVNHTKAETLYIRASAGGLTSACSSAVTVSAGTPNKLVFDTQPSATGAASTDLAQQPIVHVLDVYNNFVSTATNAVTLAPFTNAACSIAAGGTLSATTNPLNAFAGVAGFAGVDYSAAGTFYIGASAGGLTSACSSAVVISSGTATKLVFSQQPSSTATSGVNFTTQPIVQVQDASNNVVTSASNSITLAAFTDAACTVASTATINATTNPLSASSGVANFAGVNHTKAETLYVRASAGGLTSACSTLVTVSAGAANKLAFSQQPSSTATAGTNFTTQPIVQVHDASNNLVTSASHSITLASYTDAACTVVSTSAILATTNPLSASSGVATFAGVRHNKAETLYIRASTGGLTSACSTLVTVSAAAASKLAFSQQPSSTAAVSGVFGSQPIVQVQDAYNNVITSASNSITLAAFTDAACSIAAGGTLGATTNPLSASSGSASFAGVNYNAAATIYLGATTGGLTSACSNAVVVSAGAATKLAFFVQPSTTATAGTNFGTQPQVEIQDATNTRVTIATDSITLAAYTDASCTTPSGTAILATTNPLSATSGLSTFAGVRHTKAETIYLRASAGGLTSACSNAIAVSPAAANKLIFSQQPSTTGTAGTNFAQQPIVQVQDTYNNVVTSASTSITLASYTDAACTAASTATINATTNPLSATSGVSTFAGVNHTKAEALYIRATGGGLTQACSTLVTVSPAAASKLVYTVQPSGTGTPATALAQQPTLQVQDAYNNLVTSASNSITLDDYTDAACTSTGAGTTSATTNPLSASSGTATFAGLTYSTVGTVYFRASTGGLTSACSSAVVFSAGAATKLAFFTQPSGTATAGTNFGTQPAVEVQDAGNFRVTSASNSITIAAYTDASCTTPSGTSILATTNPLSATSGLSTFAAVRHTKAETIYLRASTGGLTSACSSAVVVSAAAASKLAFVTQPSSTGVPSVALTTQPIVQVQDAYNNIITSASNSITLDDYTDAGCTSTGAGTTSATTNPLSATSGSASFAGLTYSLAGVVYFRASTGGLTSACSSSVTFAAGAATKLGFFTQPSSTATAGTNFGTQPAVEVLDASNNRVTTATDAITLAAYTDASCTTPSGTAILATTNPLSATSGLSTFAAVRHTKAETIYIRASAGGLTSACSTAVAVSAAAANKLAFSQQPSATGTGGVALAQQPIVQVRDTYDNLITGASNSITLADYTDASCTTTAPGTTLATTNPLSATSGVATFAGVGYSGTGTIYFRASTGGLTSACSSAVVLSAGAATKLSFYQEAGISAQVDAVIAQQPIVRILDASNNLVTSATNAITIAGFADGTCTTPVSGTVVVTTNPLNAVAGEASFAGLKYQGSDAPLGIWWRATAGGLTSACTVGNTVINPGPKTKLTFTIQPSTTALAGNAIGAPYAQVKIMDAFNNVDTSATDTITLTAYTDAACTVAGTGVIGGNSWAASSGARTFNTLTYSKAGVVYFKASASGLTDACSTGVTISPNTPTKTIFVTQPPATGTDGVALSTQPVVAVTDALDNVITTNNGTTITLSFYSNSICTIFAGGSMTNGSLATSSGLATFTTATPSGVAGNVYVRATNSGGYATACSSVVNVAGAPILVWGMATSQNFGNIGVGDWSGTTTARFYNNGSAVATGCSAPTFAGANPTEFEITSDGCGTANLNQSSYCDVSIRARPTSGGAKTAHLTRTCTVGGTVTTDVNGYTYTGHAAEKLVFTTQPATTVSAGNFWSPAPVVQVQSNAGTIIYAYATAITVEAFTDASCTTPVTLSLQGTTSAAPVSGSRTFNAMYPREAGATYLKASSGSLTTACSNLTTVSAGSGSLLAYTTMPSTTAFLGSPFAAQPVVEVRDAFGNKVTSTVHSIQLGLYTNAACSTGSAGSVTAVTNPLNTTAGVATFSGANINGSGTGTFYVRAWASGLTVACSNAITVSNPILAINAGGLPIDFGYVRLTYYSYTRDFYFQNSSFTTTLTGCTAPVLANSTDFEIVSDACGTNDLNPGMQCKVGVRARPTTATTISNVLFSRNCANGGQASALISTQGGNGYPISGPLTGSSTAADFKCFLLSNGTIACGGVGTQGQLGYGTSGSKDVPVLVSGITTATQVTQGYAHACAILADTTVKCWGSNSMYQLSDGTTTTRYSPVTTGGALTNVVEITAGNFFTCALLGDGTAKCWGDGSSGQIGNGASAQVAIPTAVSSLSGAIGISAGTSFACALINDGTVKCWGDNSFGQLGNGTSTPSNVPVNVTGITTAIQVAAGQNFSCALLADKTVQCWGLNLYGNLGNGTTTNSNTPVVVTGLTNVAQISLGGDHTCAKITGGGTVKCWGRNLHGQVGNDSFVNVTTPVTVNGIAGVAHVSSYSDSSCAVSMFDQNVTCWGHMGGQQASSLMIGKRKFSRTPASNSLFASTDMAQPTLDTQSNMLSCALMNDGTVKCWGDNANGFTGDGTTANRYGSPQTVVGVTGAIQLASASQAHCALLSGGTIKCWGNGGWGGMGNGAWSNQTTPVTVSTITNGTQIVAGMNHFCALRATGNVWCWGDGANGKLGGGVMTSMNTPNHVGIPGVMTQIAAGGNTSCALASDGVVYCWGLGSSGQVGNGLGNATNSGAMTVGGTAGGGGLHISVGADHACAVMTGGVMRCWGANGAGQLGVGDTTNRLSSTLVVASKTAVKVNAGNNSTCALYNDGTVGCWGIGDVIPDSNPFTPYKNAPFPAYGLTDVVDLFSNSFATLQRCAKFSDNTFKCWGEQSSGSLGIMSDLTAREPASGWVP